MRKDSERSQSGRSKRIKVDAPNGSKWAVQNTESERSKTLKVDGSKSLKWPVTYKNERSKRYGWRNLESTYVHKIRVHLGVGYNYGEHALRIRIHLGLRSVHFELGCT